MKEIINFSNLVLAQQYSGAYRFLELQVFDTTTNKMYSVADLIKPVYGQDPILQRDVPLEVEPDLPVAEVQINPEFKYDLVIWDLETTGLDCTKDEIIEIGCIAMCDGVEVERKSWVLDNGVEIPKVITEITGIDINTIKAEGRPAKECYKEFLDILSQGAQHITHNGIKFDIPFLVNCTTRYFAYGPSAKDRMRTVLDERAIDTAAMYKGRKLGIKQKEGQSNKNYADIVLGQIVKGLKFNIGACCDDLGIDRTGITQHRAMGDVTLTHEIYKKLIA